MTRPLPFLLAPALLLAAAPAAAPLRPGLWSFTNQPGAATLDGRVLHELPVGPITSETACLTPAQAADPARWLARDVLADCTLAKTSIAGGKVDITGTCKPRSDGFAPGTLRLTGTASATRYQLFFQTIAHGENGRMGFGGTMMGRRVGDCPGG